MTVIVPAFTPPSSAAGSTFGSSAAPTVASESVSVTVYDPPTTTFGVRIPLARPIAPASVSRLTANCATSAPMSPSAGTW